MNDEVSSDTRTNLFLRFSPPETHSWQGKVTLGLGYPTFGWIVLTVTCTTYLQGAIVRCSDAFDPFPDFIHWLESIALERLPASCEVDEEGTIKTFRASTANADEIVLEILDSSDTDEPVDESTFFLYVQVARQQLLAEFLKRWDDFIGQQFNPADWPYGADLRALDVSKIRAFVQG